MSLILFPECLRGWLDYPGHSVLFSRPLVASLEFSGGSISPLLLRTPDWHFFSRPLVAWGRSSSFTDGHRPPSSSLSTILSTSLAVSSTDRTASVSWIQWWSKFCGRCRRSPAQVAGAPTPFGQRRETTSSARSNLTVGPRGLLSATQAAPARSSPAWLASWAGPVAPGGYATPRVLCCFPFSVFLIFQQNLNKSTELNSNPNLMTQISTYS